MLCPGGLTATPVLAGRRPGKYIVYAVSWDGGSAQLDVATGEESKPPAKFVPPNGKPYGAEPLNGVIYTTRRRDAAAIPNNFYAYDLATKKVGNWGAGQRRHVAAHRTIRRQGRDGLRGQRRRRLLSRAAIYGQAIIGVKQNPKTKALE